MQKHKIKNKKILQISKVPVLATIFVDDRLDHVAIVVNERIETVDTMCCRDLHFIDSVVWGRAMMMGLAIGTCVAAVRRGL